MDNHHTGESLELLRTYYDATEAAIMQTKLKEAGIESFLHDENIMGMNPMGGIKLKVFSNDLEKATQILENKS
ncbi:MAG: DUF2007 domain-containing protein [Chitinophagaceae bacterium]|nr:DUF2007 domain-containing protein [Chitinophagaceae bacterium]MCB0740230.1 DUF2007 domain-containing protein [Chitinophagaceae bacterium]HQV05462.1 DUF2007 domain-containing protein [Chitinophagaceae bacterium]